MKEVGLSHFHATDQWGTSVGNKFAPKVRQLTVEHLMLGYVVRVNKDDYKNHYIADLRPRKPQLDTMYGVAFRFLIAFLVTRLPDLLGRSDITFNIILESGAPGSKDAERIMAALKKTTSRRDGNARKRRLVRGLTRPMFIVETEEPTVYGGRWASDHRLTMETSATSRAWQGNGSRRPPSPPPAAVRPLAPL